MSHHSIEHTKQYLESVGIHPSFQRLKIFELLSDTKTHPTAESIYSELVQEIPTLSKTTIYNTLNLFQSKGIVHGITIDVNEVRYDANTSPHAHFKCDRCHRIFDVRISCSCDNGIEPPRECFDCSHLIKERHVYLKGICSDCLGL
jgi:Fur family peroxide stress response transcriptional regulator